jgi:hypothetical protein
VIVIHRQFTRTVAAATNSSRRDDFRDTQPALDAC